MRKILAFFCIVIMLSSSRASIFRQRFLISDNVKEKLWVELLKPVINFVKLIEFVFIF